MEKMMKWFDNAYGIRYVALRYFNAAGAHPSGKIGEDHSPESHLIPIVLQVVLGKREYISIYGDDYPTPDGTCIRDYIHVSDLSVAHLLALERLEKGGESTVYNLGSGQGFSVREIIEEARRVTGHPIPQVIAPRRAGDPAVLVASSRKIKEEMGWKPRLRGCCNHHFNGLGVASQSSQRLRGLTFFVALCFICLYNINALRKNNGVLPMVRLFQLSLWRSLWQV
jgi:UDP-glucose 4-epimerase